MPNPTKERQKVEQIVASVDPVAWRYVHHDYMGRKVSRYGCHAERVNGHDPIEMHPLYSRAQVLEMIGRVVDECAALIEANVQVQSTRDDMPHYFGPRRPGNTYGLEYAVAVRSFIQENGK